MQQNILPTDSRIWEQVIDRHPLTVAPEALLVDVIARMGQPAAETESSQQDTIHNPACNPAHISQGFPYALVVSDAKIVGIVTARDVIQLVVTKAELRQTTVAEVMSHQFATVNITDLKKTLLTSAISHQSFISPLAVVDDYQHLIGVIDCNKLQSYLSVTVEQLQHHVLQLENSKPKLKLLDRRKQGLTDLLNYQFETKLRRAKIVFRQDKTALQQKSKERTSALKKINKQLQQEIAQRKQVEQELQKNQKYLRLINTISTSITSAMTAEQAIKTAVKQVSRYFRDFRVVYFIIDPQGKQTVFDVINPPNMPPLLETELDLATRAPDFLRSFYQLEPIIVENVNCSAMLAPIKDVLSRDSVQAFLDIPLPHPQGLVGALCFESSQPYLWSEYEIATLMEIADYLSRVLQETHIQQEHQRIEAALQESRQMNALLAKALEHAGDAIEITNAETTIEYINPAWEETTGYSSAEAIGKKVSSLLRSDKHDDAFHQAIANTLTTGQIWRGNLVVTNKDGELYYQETTISPVFSAAGEIEHFVAVKRDITERKRIEESLRLTQFSLDHAVDAAFWVRPDGGFLYVNKAACRVLGYSYVELLLMSIRDITSHFPTTDWSKCWQELKQQKSLSFESYHRTKQGNFFPVELTINYLEFNGREYGFAFARDITKRQQAEEALRLRDQAITATNNGIVIVDARSPNLPIISINPAFERLTGYSAAEVMGKNCRFLQAHDHNQEPINQLREAVRNQQPCTVVVRNYRKDGSLFWNELSIAPIHDSDGRLTHYVGIQSDISDRKKAEEELKAANAEMAALFAAMTDLIFVLDASGRFLRMPSVNLEILYRPEIGRIGTTLHETFSQEIADTFLSHIQTCLMTQQTVTTEYNLISHGRPVWAHASISPIDGNTVIWVSRNITDRKHTENALRRQLAAIEAATDGIAVLNSSGQYTYLNYAHVAMLGYDASTELEGKSWRAVYHSDEIERFEQEIFPALAQVGQWRGEAIATRKDGSSFPQEISLTVIEGEGMVGVCQDITERKQAEEQLKASLHDKELLLKEVHHRVKNNLQVISSIFSLQSQHVKDPDTLTILSESQNRIRSMALIHEKLYQTSSLAKIDFSDYIRNLVRNLFSSYNINSQLIQLNLKVSNISLNIDTAIPCGLLLNELVSNSLKHAFPDDRCGEIVIDFAINSQDKLHLMVRDTGIGLPEDWDAQQSNSLGLRLVRALTRQLNGKFDMSNDCGTVFSMIFPKPKD